MKDVKIWINSSEKEIQKAEAVEAQYTAELETALAEYHELEARAVELDPNELDAACCSIRPEEEKQAALTLKSRHGNSYDPVIMQRARDKAANLLSKESVQTRVRFNDSQKDKLENERRRRSTHKKKAEERER